MTNNNKQVIRRLCNRSMKRNGRRNLFAIVSIVLVCLLFTGTFTVADGVTKSFERQNMRRVGTSSHAGFKNITWEQYEKLSSHKDVKQHSYSIFFGKAENPELIKRGVELRYIQGMDFKWSMAKVAKGRLPKEKMEVMLDDMTLNSLGIPCKIGQKVNISYNLEGKEVSDDFTLCGYYEGDPLAMVSEAYFSKEYVDEVLSIHTQKEWEELKNYTNGIGLIQMDVMFKDSRDIEGCAIKVIRESGYDENRLGYGVNWAYIGGNDSGMDLETLALLIVIVLVVILCGYLIISNIFYISIVGDIRFYGLLKTLGATTKQLKKLIYRQADFLCLMGIPAGLIGGWFFGAGLIPGIMEVADIDIRSGDIVIPINPWVFLFSAFFTFFTVRAGCFKSGRMVKKISPVEAVKFVYTGKSVRTASESASRRFSAGRMALKNVFREKRRAVSVLMSMTLGMLLLLFVFTFARSFSMEKYAMDMMGNTDFILTSANGNHYVEMEAEDAAGIGPDWKAEQTLIEQYLSDNHIEEKTVKPMIYGATGISLSGKSLERFKGFQEENIFEKQLADAGEEEETYYKKMIDDVLAGEEKLEARIYSMDCEMASRFRVLSGSFDAQKYKTGKYILLTSDDANLGVDTYNLGSGLYDVGDSIEIGGNSYEVMAFINIPYFVSVGYFTDFSFIGVLPVEEYEKISDLYGGIYGISINVEDEQEKQADSLINHYTETSNPMLKYQSKITVAEELSSLLTVVKMAGGALVALTFLIALMNLVNTTITGILARKTEFAMLESIGMEEKQKMRILYKEGMWQLLISGGASLVLGTLFCQLIFRRFCESMSWLVYRFTLAPLLVGIALFLLAGILVPYFYCRAGREESLVETLRAE